MQATAAPQAKFAQCSQHGEISQHRHDLRRTHPPSGPSLAEIPIRALAGSQHLLASTAPLSMQGFTALLRCKAHGYPSMHGSQYPSMQKGPERRYARGLQFHPEPRLTCGFAGSFFASTWMISGLAAALSTASLVDHHFLDAFQAEQFEHGIQQDIFHDRAQPARAGLAFDRPLGNGRERIFRGQLDTFQLEQALILLDQACSSGLVRMISTSSGRSGSRSPADGHSTNSGIRPNLAESSLPAP